MKANVCQIPITGPTHVADSGSVVPESNLMTQQLKVHNIAGQLCESEISEDHKFKKY